MKVFFSSAQGARWMSGWQRAQALRELGHQVVAFPHDPYERLSVTQKVIKRLRGEAFDRGVLDSFNQGFLSDILEARPEVAWVEKALMLLPDTLERARQALPGCVFVCFQDDDPFGLRSWERPIWSHFIEAIPLYDLHFVKKEVDLVEFREHGAAWVELFPGGFYPGIFHPVPVQSVPPKFRHDVSFVGTPLDHRVGVTGDLMDKYRVPVHVYGNSWWKTWLYYRHRRLFHPAAVERDYVNVIAGSRISLGFVSSSNRDEYTMRTFEIPASKGFLLAERTPKHLELFEEGKEAEFFGSAQECAEKIRFYLAHESLRLKITEAGYKRCRDSDYSLHRSLRRALIQVASARRS